MYINNFHLDDSPLDVSLNKLSEYSERAQMMAVWSDCRISDETAFVAFHKIVDYLNFEVERLDCDTVYARSAGAFAGDDKRTKLFLSVEDARLLCNRIDRLKILYARGVRFLIPVWGGSSIIGGAHDTNEGLTEFGKQVVNECSNLGIITDVSHASEKTAEEILDAASLNGKTVMASHSNSYSVCPHSRNLRDYQFEAVKRLGGIVGLSLCNLHISGKETAEIDDVIKHIEHYMSLGGEDTVALGCDFDGTDYLPKGLENVSKMPLLANRLAALNYSDALIDKIFYANAKAFIEKNL
jgi:membrane dipeptidase